jgi:hypothetical protein
VANTIIPWPCLIDNPPNLEAIPSKTDPLNPNPNIITKVSENTKTGDIPSVIPLKCLHDATKKNDSSSKPPQAVQKQTKTFAQVVNNLCDIPSSQLPQPIIKGDDFLISIPRMSMLLE